MSCFLLECCIGEVLKILRFDQASCYGYVPYGLLEYLIGDTSHDGGLYSFVVWKTDNNIRHS